MKLLSALLLLLLLPASAFAIEPNRDGSWVPVVEFSLEGSDFAQTMHWVSGWSYALSAVAQDQTRDGSKRLICLPDRGYVESRVILTILNSKFKGRRITSEQASAAIWQGIKVHYACPTKRG